MIWNSIPDEERLRLWKKLRSDLDGKSSIEALEGVAIFCQSMPFGSRSMDYYSPNDWPTPWEILYYGDLCTSSISLLMFYTLDLLTHTGIELLLVDDSDDIYLLPRIDNTFILNYELGKVNMFSEVMAEFKILKIYTKDQIKKIT